LASSSGRDELSGDVEVDESYIGGAKPGKRGRGAHGKTLVGIAVELKSPKGYGRVRMQVLKNFEGITLQHLVRKTIEEGSVLITDGAMGHRSIDKFGYTHKPVNVKQSGSKAHEMLPAVHRAASLVKRWLLGTHQGAVEPAHLQAYLDEFRFRFNRRTARQRGLLFYRLLEQSVVTDPVPYEASRRTSACATSESATSAAGCEPPAAEHERRERRPRADPGATGQADWRGTSERRQSSARSPSERPLVRNLRLREEVPPEDHVVVIRGGIIEDRADDELRKRAQDAEARIGLLAQSVLLAAEADVSSVCLRDGRVSRYGQVNLSTVARLRRAGFALLPTLDAPHYSVVLPDLNSETIQRFRNCFDPAQPNPPSTLPE
jgi:transposase-like protein